MGDEIPSVPPGTTRMRVTAVVPEERIGEFVDRLLYGMLEVVPV